MDEQEIRRAFGALASDVMLRQVQTIDGKLAGPLVAEAYMEWLATSDMERLKRELISVSESLGFDQIGPVLRAFSKQLPNVSGACMAVHEATQRTLFGASPDYVQQALSAADPQEKAVADAAAAYVQGKSDDERMALVDDLMMMDADELIEGQDSVLVSRALLFAGRRGRVRAVESACRTYDQTAPTGVELPHPSTRQGDVYMYLFGLSGQLLGRLPEPLEFYSAYSAATDFEALLRTAEDTLSTGQLDVWLRKAWLLLLKCEMEASSDDGGDTMMAYYADFRAIIALLVAAVDGLAPLTRLGGILGLLSQPDRPFALWLECLLKDAVAVNLQVFAASQAIMEQRPLSWHYTQRDANDLAGAMGMQ